MPSDATSMTFDLYHESDGDTNATPRQIGWALETPNDIMRATSEGFLTGGSHLNGVCEQWGANNLFGDWPAGSGHAIIIKPVSDSPAHAATKVIPTASILTQYARTRGLKNSWYRDHSIDQLRCEFHYPDGNLTVMDGLPTDLMNFIVRTRGLSLMESCSILRVTYSQNEADTGSISLLNRYPGLQWQCRGSAPHGWPATAAAGADSATSGSADTHPNMEEDWGIMSALIKELDRADAEESRKMEEQKIGEKVDESSEEGEILE